MPRRIDVHLLPVLTSPEELRGGCVVVIDVLRASTTITHALAAGAKYVWPCLEIEQAKTIAARLNAEGQQAESRGSVTSKPAILGGERHATPIPGFDLGNSPGDYRPDTVGGRVIVFTTTNGTRAMEACQLAERVLIGSFVNRAAIIAAVRDTPHLHLLCAGTSGKVTREDVLFAGAVVEKLLTGISGNAADSPAMNDSAALARDAWRSSVIEQGGEGPRELVEMFAGTQGGRNLHRVGLAHDLAAAAAIDTQSIVPRLDLATWRIT